MKIIYNQKKLFIKIKTHSNKRNNVHFPHIRFNKSIDNELNTIKEIRETLVETIF